MCIQVISAISQPLAYHDVNDGEEARFDGLKFAEPMSKTTTTLPAIKETRPSAIVGDSLEFSSESATISASTYLERLMWSHDWRILREVRPGYYEYLDKYLDELEDEFGTDPFFFERYLHPEVQFLTGCNMGQVGMPIVERNENSQGGYSVSLSSRTEHAKIYYTTDGSEPSANSHLYSSPIHVIETSVLRAIAVRDDMEASPIALVNASEEKKQEAALNQREDKVMGIFSIPNSENVLVKYQTQEPGEIAVTLIDMNRTVHHIDFIQTQDNAYDRHIIDCSKVPVGPYLIKFKFDSGKTTYRQVMKE